MTIDWDRVRVRIAWGERVRCEPDWRLGRRGPEAPEITRKFTIWYVWDGRGTVELRGKIVPLRPGICLWMRPLSTYNVEQDLQHRLGVSTVHFDLLDETGKPIMEAESLPPEVHDLMDSVYVDAILRRVVELVGGRLHSDENAMTPERRTARVMLSGLLMDLDRRAEQASHAIGDVAKRRRIQEMMQLASEIRENSGNIPSIRELAARAGYSPDHFTRLFESVIGMSPQALVVQVRIDRARQLLIGTDLSMKEIANSLGYQDVFFFSRQFKQKAGMPPSEYRKRAIRHGHARRAAE